MAVPLLDALDRRVANLARGFIVDEVGDPYAYADPALVERPAHELEGAAPDAEVAGARADLRGAEHDIHPFLERRRGTGDRAASAAALAQNEPVDCGRDREEEYERLHERAAS